MAEGDDGRGRNFGMGVAGGLRLSRRRPIFRPLYTREAFLVYENTRVSLRVVTHLADSPSVPPPGRASLLLWSFLLFFSDLGPLLRTSS